MLYKPVAWLSTMEPSDPYEGFPQPSWAYYTLETREECGEVRRSVYYGRRRLESL